MRARVKRGVIGWICCGAVAVLGCGVDGRGADERGADGRGAEGPALAAAEQAATVACVEEADCDPGLACVAGACQACSAHGQCESDVCDQGAATSMGPGACLPQDAVVYADPGAYPACQTGDGTLTDPVCDIRAALPLEVGTRYAVRARAGRYRPFAVSGRTVYVFGPGDGSAVVGEEDISSAVRVTSGATAVLDGLDFGVHVLTGVTCVSSTLSVRRGTAQGDYHGIRSTGCDLQLERVRAGGSRAGLTIAGGTYRVTNSFFRGGDLPAVVFDGASTGSFQFNTVQGGGELSPGGVDCGASARTIADSIVVGATPGPGGAQTVGACTHRRVVVGSGDTRALPGLVHIDPDLDADGRLLDTAPDRACCIDRGARYVSSLYRDFFGTPRLQGASNDVGAHELPVPAVLQATADSHIRTDLDVRRNDNHGCQESVEIGTSRGGGGIPEGGPDAMRALVQFDLASLPPAASVDRAVLELTVDGYDHGLATSIYQVDVHRVVPSGARTPWIEGDGLEIGATLPAGCTDVDSAAGVAWAGAGDNTDPAAANNVTQPDFDPAVIASAAIRQASDAHGDVIRWDVTDLVRAWRNGTAPNLGVALRDVTTDGVFRGVRLGARDGLLRGFPGAVPGPRLVVTLAR